MERELSENAHRAEIWLRGSFALGLSLTVVGCGPAPPLPNVVLISIDSLRADHLGCYGYDRTTSPSIDALARDGVVFERAYSTSSWTLPAHISMLTSLYPEQHGVISHAFALSDKADLLSEVLSSAGYRSAAVVSGPYLDRGWGYDQGWESYDDSLVGPAGPEQKERSHRVVNSGAVHALVHRQLNELREGPFFLFVHYWDVHYDYMPPPPFDTLFDSDYAGEITGEGFEADERIHAGMDERDLSHLVALYDGEIRWVDSWIGELTEDLRSRGLLERTIVAVTSDHGDEFFEHGRKGHQKNLFEPVLWVPLILRLPESRLAGSRVAGAVSVIDLPPTIAALVGVGAAPSWRGRALLDLSGRRPPTSVPVFADLFGRRKAMIDWPWKLLEGPDPIEVGPRVRGLFDLAGDPLERRNLKKLEADRAGRMSHALAAAQIEFASDRQRHPPRAHRISEELRHQLRALGYL